MDIQAVLRRMDSPSEMILVRFTSQGIVDATFGDLGSAVTTIKSGLTILRVLSQSDVELIGVGNINDATELAQFAIVRFKPNGQVDSSFGLGTLSVSAINDTVSFSDGWLQKIVK